MARRKAIAVDVPAEALAHHAFAPVYFATIKSFHKRIIIDTMRKALG